ncbi:hypothetical protein RJ640_017577, partial [Escallonia rubra]
MSLLQFLLMILHSIFLEFCTCTDTILPSHPIKDSETIVSNNTNFKLGFFSPEGSKNRYVGILYNVTVQTAIWVANRDKPLNDSSGTVTIMEDGNLVVLDGQQEIVWSSNLTNSLVNSSAQLLDTWNLILKDNSNGRALWQSFQHPSDSCLQGMRLDPVSNEDDKNLITSWNSPSDASTGSFSFGVDPLNIPQVFVWNDSNPYWRSGPWNGQIFIGIPNMDSIRNNGFHVVPEDNGSLYMTVSFANQSIPTYFVLNSKGCLMQKCWYDGYEDWRVNWTNLENECDVYGKCGAFGICNSLDSPICTCLEGFEPKNITEWSKGNWTSGCERKTQLQCERNNSLVKEGKEDGFLKLTSVKVPNFAERSY